MIIHGNLVPVEGLREEPYAHVLCFPRIVQGELDNRIRQMQTLGITHVEFDGRRQVLSLPVLGKGYVGVVLIAYRNGDRFAVKIRRVDADRARMQREADLLKKANEAGVGPRLVDVSDDFLLMQFIDGESLPLWIDHVDDKIRVTTVLRRLLEQCWKLDQVGLDHGELSNAKQHVVVNPNNEPVIVDFETASTARRPSNVTSMCQFLFIGSLVAKSLFERLRFDRDAVLASLRSYKSQRTRENFGRILAASGLQTM